MKGRLKTICLALSAVLVFGLAGALCGIAITELFPQKSAMVSAAPEVDEILPVNHFESQASYAQAVETPVVEQVKNEFVARTYRGGIGVFSSENQTEPFQVIDIDVEKLRKHDKDELQKGIVVKSDEELMLLIEDFGS